MNAVRSLVLGFCCFVSAMAFADVEVVTNIILTTEWAPVYEGCPSVERVTLVSGLSCGTYIGNGRAYRPEFAKVENGILSAQFQNYQGTNRKGVLVEFKVEDEVLYARAVWARLKTAPSADAVVDMEVSPYSSQKLATTLDAEAYGIQQLTFTVKPPPSLVVVGSPVEPGTPDHDGWGENYGLQLGTQYSFHAPADKTDYDGDTRWTCRGWTLKGQDGTTTSGEGRECTFTYTQMATLTWHFDVEYRVLFACDGGTIATNKIWYALGETASATCTPGGSKAFVRWSCDDAELVSKLTSNPISFVVSRPETLAAVLTDPIVVRPGDDLVGAVTGAADNSVIVLEDGVYDIASEILIDRPLTLKSRNGAERTVIRRVLDSAGTNVQRCVRMTHASAVVQGVAITGGGGNVVHASSTRNDDSTGAGVCMTAGRLTDCIVTNNVYTYTRVGGSTYVWGAGVAMLGDGLVSGCTIAQNGGIGAANILVNVFGGGVYMTAGQLVDTLVSGNFVSSSTDGTGQGVTGGGIGVRAEGGQIARCRILRNWMDNPGSRAGKSGYGAGLYAKDVDEVSDTLIAGNETTMSSGRGGGVYAKTSLTLRNCTIAGNRALKGGGLICESGVKVTFCNCIVQGNESLDPGEPPDINTTSGGAEYRNCLLADSPRAVFADPENDDWSLKSVASPGVDAGADDEVAGSLDCAGNLRKVGPVDIGCYELQYEAGAVGFTHEPESTVVGGEMAFRASAVPGTTGVEWSWRVDGGSWSDWDEENEASVSFATEGDHTVEVKGRVGAAELSTYSETVHAYPAAITAEATAAGVLAAIAQAGGGTVVHVPAGDYTFDQTIVIDKAVTLVGDGGAEGTRFFRQTSSSVNTSQRCLTLNHARAVVRGITFSGGRNNSANYTDYTVDNVGAGVWIAYAGGTLDSCVITNSVFAQCRGGGLGMEGPGVVTNCLIVDSSCVNAARFYGAGVYMSNGLLTHSTVMRSSGASTYTCYAGGVYMDGGTLSHCKIVDNAITKGSDGQLGGGVYIAYGAAKMDNCLIVRNQNNASTGKGGGIAAVAGANIVNCTDVDNTSSTSGSSVHTTGAATFANCILQGDGTNPVSGEGAAATYVGCFTEGDARFRRPGTGDYRLRNGSPCIDAGVVQEGQRQTLDLRGHRRVAGVSVDIGCYECGDGAMLFVR